MNECTRCIGDYSVKGGYKENETLRCAKSEPVISSPDIFGPVPLSEIQGMCYVQFKTHLFPDFFKFLH